MKAVSRITSAQLGRICGAHSADRCMSERSLCARELGGLTSADDQAVQIAPRSPSSCSPHVRVLVPALGDEAAQRLGAVGVHPRPLAVDGHLQDRARSSEYVGQMSQLHP